MPKIAPLKTYSRRALPGTKHPSNGITEAATSKAAVPVLSQCSKIISLVESEPILPKLLKRSSIHNYFKPVSEISTPPLTSSDGASGNDDDGDISRRSSTPCSSPPPLFAEEKADDSGRMRKKRRLNVRGYLAPIENINDDHSSSTAELKSKTEKSKKKQKMKETQQSRLDLNAPMFIECKICKMQYNKTEKADRNAHNKFHDQFVNGKRSRRKGDADNVVFEEHVYVSGGVREGEKKREKHRLIVVDRGAGKEKRDYAREALEMSYADMDGVRFEDEELWSEIMLPGSASGKQQRVSRFKMFVYYVDDNIIGVLLAERITKAQAYRNGRVDEEEHKAVLGVERIWVRANQRGKGIASRMMDVTRDCFVDGMVVGKKDVAFSAPTEAGRKLARRYCEGVFEQSEFLMTL